MRILALSTNYRYHQDLLQALFEKGIIAEFVTSHNPEKENLSCEFYIQHKTKLIDGRKFYRIEELQKLVPADAPALDKPVIDYFENTERDFYTISDRHAYFPKSFRCRKRLFRHTIRFWLDFYKKNNIEAIFSICTPHNFPDFLAFHVAKYLGIKTMLTTDTMINNHVLLLEDYRQVFKVPENFMAGKNNDEIKATINQTFIDAAFAESQEIALARQWNDKTLGLKGVNTKPEKVNYAKMAIKLVKKAARFLNPRPFQSRFKATFAMNGEFSNTARRIFRLQSGRRLRRLRKAYEKLAVYPDFSKKFIYFAMHLNPERTTQPEAEIFEDHLLAIEILAAAAPKDWLVYVKENPAQYGRKLNLVNGRHFRDASDYADFTRLPNVKLLRQDIKTQELIDKATIVSSLKGSVGWEVMEKGRGCIIFANAWYAACRNAYRVHDVKSCQDAIKAILEKTPAEVLTDKLKFFSYMQDRIVIGSMGGHHNLEIATMPYAEMVESLAVNLAKYFSAGTAKGL